MSSPDSLDAMAALWVAVGLGLGTLAFRVGFAAVRRRWTLSDRVESALEWIPVAALSAMVIPAFGPSSAGAFDGILVLAGVVTGWICWRTRNLLVAILAGLVVVWWIG